MTELHDEVPPRGRHSRGRQDHRDYDEPLLTHGGDLYTHGGGRSDAGTSWAPAPTPAPDPSRQRSRQQAVPRDDRQARYPAQYPAPAERPDRADRYGADRYGGDRPSPRPRPRPYPDGQYRDAGWQGAEVSGGQPDRYPDPYGDRQSDRYDGYDRYAEEYPNDFAAGRSTDYPAAYPGEAPATVGYADDPHRGGDPYRDPYGDPYRDPYDDPYDDGMSPPDDPGGRHRRPGGGSGGGRWKTYAKRGGAIVGVLALLASGFVFYEYKHLDSNIKRVDVLQTHDNNIRQAAKQKNAENFLLIGSDTRAGANAKFGGDTVIGARSDTTILAHLSPNHDKAILISIPRDSWVDIPSCQKPDGQTTQEQKGQFNSAFAIGGPNCTIRTVQKLTGIAVTHYVQVDFTGFQNMVHALGGITMCSTISAFDPDSGLRLVKGNNLLDGAQALAYVRARYALGNKSDLQRIQRQQRFLGAMMRKATSGDTLLNPVKLQRFLEAATKSLTLDKTTHIGDLKDLASALHGLDPAKVSFITPFISNPAYDPNDPSNPRGGRVLLDDDKNRVLFDSIINDQTSKPSAGPTSAAPKPTATTPASQQKVTVAPDDIKVYVFNGVGTNGLAGKVKDSLSVLGFSIVDTGNQGTGLATSEVHYGPTQLEAARTLAASVPGSVLKPDSHYQHSVALIVGSDYNGVRQVAVGDPYTPYTPGAGGASAAARPQAGPITPSGAVNAADTSCGT